MSALIEKATQSVRGTRTEIKTLARTVKKRGNDILAYLDRPTTSNGTTGAVNIRMGQMRGSAH